MSERATERDGEQEIAIKSDETGRWVRIPDGVDGVRAYQLLRAATPDAPTEEREAEDRLREIDHEAWVLIRKLAAHAYEAPGISDIPDVALRWEDALVKRIVRLADRAPSEKRCTCVEPSPHLPGDSGVVMECPVHGEVAGAPTDEAPVRLTEEDALLLATDYLLGMIDHDKPEHRKILPVANRAWKAARRLRQPEPAREGEGDLR